MRPERGPRTRCVPDTISVWFDRFPPMRTKGSSVSDPERDREGSKRSQHPIYIPESKVGDPFLCGTGPRQRWVTTSLVTERRYRRRRGESKDSGRRRRGEWVRTRLLPGEGTNLGEWIISTLSVNERTESKVEKNRNTVRAPRLSRPSYREKMSSP